MILPAIDLIDGQCVRLYQGDYAQKSVYSASPLAVAKEFAAAGCQALHIVDLDAAKAGNPINSALVLEIAQTVQVPVQIGGGIRDLATVAMYLENGVTRVIIGPAACEDGDFVRQAVEQFGSDRIVVSVDIKNGVISTRGWLQNSVLSIDELIGRLQVAGVRWLIVTDVSKDGTLSGANYCITSRFVAAGFQTITAGGVSNSVDITELKKCGASGAIIGRGLYEGTITLADALAAATNTNALLKRIIPCLDVKAGRVVKGTHFTQLRDAGDAVSLARHYSESGADELIFLDITATEQRRAAMQKLVRAVAAEINIPFTVGGGINSLQSIYELLAAGADKVSLGTIAVERPEFVREAAQQFGAQCIVISLDAKRQLDRWRLYTHGGKQPTAADAVEHARLMLNHGAGELLVNSMDRDGAKQGFDTQLLQAICNAVTIPVIASSGAGSAADFLKVFSETTVDAALGATIFHYNEVSINEVKTLLNNNGIKVRC